MQPQDCSLGQSGLLHLRMALNTITKHSFNEDFPMRFLPAINYFKQVIYLVFLKKKKVNGLANKVKTAAMVLSMDGSKTLSPNNQIICILMVPYSRF